MLILKHSAIALPKRQHIYRERETGRLMMMMMMMMMIMMMMIIEMIKIVMHN